MATLTARDIAKHIQRPGESLTAAVDRFRNWAKMGIIKPSGERNPGTGRKKRYSADALLDAVVLQTLTDTLGSPATSFGPTLHEISKMVRHGVSKGAQLLVVARSDGDSQKFDIQLCKMNEIGRFIQASSETSVDVHVVLNLKRLIEPAALQLPAGELKLVKRKKPLK